MKDSETKKMFPRNKQISDMLPALYVKFVPENNSLNLDTLFPNLQKWIFNPKKVANITKIGENDGVDDNEYYYYKQSSKVYLFQAGKKKHFGFMQRDKGSCAMMYLPLKPDNLANQLECFEQGSKIKPLISKYGSVAYGWHSVVLLLRSQLTEKLQKKYDSREAGFVDSIVVSDMEHDIVTEAFPKIAALAGLKQDKKVPKGWISFEKRINEKCSLLVCTGEVKTIKSNAPAGTAWDG